MQIHAVFDDRPEAMIIQLRLWHLTCCKDVSVDLMTDTWSWIFILSFAGVKQLAPFSPHVPADCP